MIPKSAFFKFFRGSPLFSVLSTGLLYESRHTIVCHAAQKAGTPHRGYIDRKKENVIFTLLYLGDPLSNWNQICYKVSHQPGEPTYQS